MSANERHGLGGHQLEQEVSHRTIQCGAGNALTGRLGMRDAGPLTEIIRHDTASAALVVADRHPFPTLATQDEPLEQGRPFARWSKSLRSIGLAIHRQLLVIALILLPGNVTPAR